MALLCGAVVAGLETSRPVVSPRSMTDLLIAGCCAVIAVVTVSGDREYAEQLLAIVEKEAADFLGGALTGSGVEWLT